MTFKRIVAYPMNITYFHVTGTP